jgi:hypothetical protein
MPLHDDGRVYHALNLDLLDREGLSPSGRMWPARFFVKRSWIYSLCLEKSLNVLDHHCSANYELNLSTELMQNHANKLGFGKVLR